MGKPSIYVESENGIRTLRRNRVLEPGVKVLVVDDVLTTGKSLYAKRDAIERAGGEVIAYAVLIDRSAPEQTWDRRLFASYKVAANSYAPDEVPAWLADQPLVKPGTSAKPPARE